MTSMQLMFTAFIPPSVSPKDAEKHLTMPSHPCSPPPRTQFEKLAWELPPLPPSLGGLLGRASSTSGGVGMRMGALRGTRPEVVFSV